MVPLSLAFFAGTLAAFAWPSNPAWSATVGLAASAVFAALARLRFASGRPAVIMPLSLFAAACAGCAYELICIHTALARRWPPAPADERVLVEARVDGLSTRTSSGISFDAWIAPQHTPRDWHRHARLLWREAPASHPRAGQTWQLLVTLRAPGARINPASMDGERQFFRDGIDVVGTVVASSRLNKQTGSARYSLDALRERIARHIRGVVEDRDAGALIAALAVGATGEMSSEQWRIFSATGTTHLVAISGSHVTMFAIAAIAAARWLWRRFLCGRVAIPRESFAASVGILAATGYASLAGLSVPTQRTLLMLAAWQLGAGCARFSGALSSLCAALCAILLIDPFAALSSGFWLSFVAIVAIGFASGPRIVVRSKMLEAVKVQMGLFVALAPLTLGWFGSLSLAALIVNAFAIPAIGWILVPLILISLPVAVVSSRLSDMCLQLAGRLCELVWPWMQAIGDGALAQIYAHPPGWWMALAAASLAVILLPWPAAFRLGVLSSVAILAFAVRPLERSTVQVTVLDVGEATSTIVRTAGHVLVYGVGDAYGADGTLVDRVIVQLLRAQGIRAVDRVILGRSSARGSPGLTALLAATPVAQVGLPRGVPLDFAGAARCSDAARWSWDGVLFETIEAASGCVVRVSTGRHSVLLASEGEPRATVGSANIAVVHGAGNLIEGADLTILSSGRAAPRPGWLSTATSGALQFTLDAARRLPRPVEWRRVRSGPWRITPDTAPFGL